MQPVQGLHHVTAVASEPQKTVDFYRQVLGQRLVKTTVNFDDPKTHHFYCGDDVGAPGTIMTFFPQRRTARGQVGSGETAAVAYRIRPESVGFWNAYLANQNVAVAVPEVRFGEAVLSFADPNGMQLELIVSSDNPTSVHHWEAGPIPQPHTLQGFHGVTLWLNEVAATARLLTETLGYTFIAQEGDRYRYQAAADNIGRYIDILRIPDQGHGDFGSGLVHHIAFRAADDEKLETYRTELCQVGQHVTPIHDRRYFHSIYFHAPGGVLFEVATDAPGFCTDESIAELGSGLKLPPWLERDRDQIEGILPAFEQKQIVKATLDYV